MSFSYRIQVFCIQFVPFIIAVVFHEYIQGLIAYALGDHTAKRKGYLTLNPIVHLDPIGTIFFPLINLFAGNPFLVGWGRPIAINPHQFRKYRIGLLLVSLAGPLVNLILAWLFGLLFFATHSLLPPHFFFYQPFLQMISMAVPINYSLGIFNLIPLPPLDGCKLAQTFLPYTLAKKYESSAQLSIFFLAVSLMSGVFSLLSKPIHLLSHWTFSTLEKFLGVTSFSSLT